MVNIAINGITVSCTHHSQLCTVWLCMLLPSLIKFWPSPKLAVTILDSFFVSVLTPYLDSTQRAPLPFITFTNGLSVTLHIQQLIASNAQALYALKLLRAHGLCDTAIQAVFHSVVLARFLYASQAWWGFAGVQDRQKSRRIFAS